MIVHAKYTYLNNSWIIKLLARVIRLARFMLGIIRERGAFFIFGLVPRSLRPSAGAARARYGNARANPARRMAHAKIDARVGCVGCVDRTANVHG